MVVAGATILVVFVLAIVFNAPLQDIANPSSTPAEAKAPWYFAGLQELLSHLQPMVAGILIPGAALLFLVALPYLDRSKGWRIRDRKMVVIVFTVLAVSAARPHRDRRLLPRSRLVVGLALAAPLPGAVAMTDERRNEQRDTPESPPAADDRAVPRRRFLNDSWKVLGVVLVAEGAWTSYDLLQPAAAEGFGGIVDAGPVERLPRRGHGQVLPERSLLRHPVPGRPAGAVSEVSPPRMQGAVGRERPAEFKCPCHGSVYNLIGEYESGPAPRGMDRFPITIENDHVMVDTSAFVEGPPPGTHETTPPGDAAPTGGATP